MTTNLRVLEIGSGVASAYAAKLLGDHGADVIKIEPTGGSPLRRRGLGPGSPDNVSSGLFLAANLNKRSITFDLKAGEELERLLAWADILVHDLPATHALQMTLDADSLAGRHPRLVTLAITPFGQSGPYAGYNAEELTVSNAGGWANLCPATHTDPTLPPLKVMGDQCALMTAVCGAMTALAFAEEAQRSHVGEFIDLAQQAYVASVLEVGIPAYSYMGNIAARYHQRSLIPWRIFNAKDRPVFIVCVEQDQWERLVVFMGNPDWAAIDLFADQAGRAENQDLVHSFVQEFVGQMDAAELYHQAQKHRICVAPVMGMGDMSRDKHLIERQFFMQLDQDNLTYMAPAVLTTSGRATIRLPAPGPGEHNKWLDSLRATPTPHISTQQTAQHAAQAQGSDQPDLPLRGIRVLDMTWAWAGPFCSMNLAHLGAEVIRIESAKRADLYRRLPVYPPELAPGLNLSGMFNQWNQGKSSIAIDLASEAGINIVKDLIRHSDVVVQNFATGVMDRLGLGYADLRRINRKIILASISGYGQTGPYREYMGYGPAIPPLTGLAAGTGYAGAQPEEIGISMPDPTAGITAAMAVVSALAKRTLSGEGDHLDITLWEATGVLNMEGWMNFAQHQTEPVINGNRSADMAPHGCFPCAGEDRWISIACRDDQEFSRLAAMMALNDTRFATLAGRKQSEDDLEKALGSWTSSQDRWDLTGLLQAAGIAAFPALSTGDIVEDPHLNARQFIERLHHPEVGARAHTGIPWRLRNRRNGVRSPAPCLGADTDIHLSEILDMNPDELARLHRLGVLGV